MTYVTYHFMRAGEVVFTNFDETHRTPQDYAERMASNINPDYADEVHVFFAWADEPDRPEPDAIARVPR